MQWLWLWVSGLPGPPDVVSPCPPAAVNRLLVSRVPWRSTWGKNSLRFNPVIKRFNLIIYCLGYLICNIQRNLMWSLNTIIHQRVWTHHTLPLDRSKRALHKTVSTSCPNLAVATAVLIICILCTLTIVRMGRRCTAALHKVRNMQMASILGGLLYVFPCHAQGI